MDRVMGKFARAGASGGDILKQWKGAALICLWAGPGMAELCNFATECFEAEGCSETVFDLEITEGQIVTDAETIAVTRGGSEAVRVYVGVSETAFHLLTLSAGGAARYSTHLYEGPIMVSYLGECRE